MNNSVFSILFSLSISLIVSFLSLMWLIPVLRIRLLDHPNERSSHSLPIPRGGGIVFVLVTLFACVLAWSFGVSPAMDTFVQSAVVPLLVFCLAFVGFLDDRHNLPVSWRYGMQLLTALVLSLASPLVSLSIAFFPLLVLLVIAITAVINFTNFMDGLDGLVAGCMSVAIGALSLELNAPWPLWALVGSLLGFLFWNWSPARVFMGDVGSTFLGAVFAGLVLQASSWPDAFVHLLVATPLLGDACLCVLRRLLAGQRVFQAHRLHLFQRLHQAGWPHAHVALIYIAATAVLAVAMLSGGWPWVVGLAVAELMIGVWLDQRVALPFLVASKN